MTEQINYEDNLFFIIAQLQLAADGLKLNLDPSSFYGRYKQGILFFDKVLTDFEQKLFDNPHLVKLSDYLQALRRGRMGMESLINEIDRAGSELAKTFGPDRAELAALLERQKASISAISTRLRHGAENYKGPEVISEEELSILMASEDQII